MRDETRRDPSSPSATLFLFLACMQLGRGETRIDRRGHRSVTLSLSHSAPAYRPRWTRLALNHGSPCSWLPAPASFVSFCGPSHGRPVPGTTTACLLLDFHFCQYLVTRSPRSRLPALHAKQSDEQICFQKRRREEQTGPATARTTTNTRTGHSTQPGPRSARQTIQRFGPSKNSGHLSLQIRSVIGMAGILPGQFWS
jgi:hypothetical protein